MPYNPRALTVWVTQVSDELILASSSPYRAELLQRLHLPFTQQSPQVDESREDGELAEDYVLRLAQSKAETIARKNPRALVIGSDQCAVRDGNIIGKPANHEDACQQLLNASAKTVRFLTAVCVCRLEDGFMQTELVPFTVHFRCLSEAMVEHYLHTEQPYNCAGSFKSEGYGITLFESMQGSDPTALVGLPLIRLTRLLEAAGLKVV